jgi:transposase
MLISIHIFYSFIAFFLLLEQCTDGPKVVINYRNKKLFLNKGSCVQTNIEQCFQALHKHNRKYSKFSLCIQCVEYIDRNIRGIKER